MEPTIYSFSLCIALSLMLFFGFYFLFAKTPEKKIFENYLRSRRIMGVALLLLAANYSVHFFRDKVRKCQFCHIDESLHLLFVLLSVQLSTDNTARPFLHNVQKVMDTHHSMGYLLNPFRSRIIAAAGWYHAEDCIADFGCVAGDLRVCACSKSHCRIPQSRQDF